MCNLPSGDVTFLFTDIEGSTRLWERDPAAMWAAIARHNEILSESITSNGGYHFKTIGDAFQAAFANPIDGVLAAVAAQRAINSAPWPETGPIRVRMALHCGNASPTGGDYLAPCLNRLARLLGVGHGGQVLLTDLVARQVASSLPQDVRLFGLGRHRLRDLLEPEQVSQLAISGLPDHYPPLRSLEGHPHNLPIQPTPLFGRAQELETLQRWVGQDGNRLVTLTGPGGVGKSRLALQLAVDLLEDMPDGVFLVDLDPAAVTEASLVIPRIAETLGIRERGDLSLFDALVEYINGKQLLLVIDNFEQVLEAGEWLSKLLRSCTGITMIVTSRARLGLQAEREYAVQPLPTPNPARLPPVSELAELAAIQLFVQHASSGHPAFTLTESNAVTVAAICDRLDGLPLAIELAAARIRVLSPTEVLRKLSRRLDLLQGGARDLPKRQQTLRATIEWSYSLLSPDEQTLFDMLSIFGGGFAYDAADAICSEAIRIDLLSGLTALCDQSLIRSMPMEDDERRYTMLETLREFGLERLQERGQLAGVQMSHAEWCLSLAESAVPHFHGPDQIAWLDRLDSEHDNFRAVFGRTYDSGSDIQFKLGGVLWQFWYLRGHFTEGRTWLMNALSKSTPSPSAEVAHAYYGAASLAICQGDFSSAREWLELTLEIWRDLNDQAGVAGSLNGLGAIAFEQGDLPLAATYFRESAAVRRTLNDLAGAGSALHNLAQIMLFQGDYGEAIALHEENLLLRRQLGDLRGIASSLNSLGTIALDQGHHKRAIALYEEALSLRRELGDKRGISTCLNNLGNLAFNRDNLSEALAYYTESLAIDRDIGDQSGIAASLHNLGSVALAHGDLETAATHLSESLAVRWRIQEHRSIPESLDGAATLASARGTYADAARLFSHANHMRSQINIAVPPDDAERLQQVWNDVVSHMDSEQLDMATVKGRTESTDVVIASALDMLRGHAATGA